VSGPGPRGTAPEPTTRRPPPSIEGNRNVEREKALEMALSQIEKQYGKGSVM